MEARKNSLAKGKRATLMLNGWNSPRSRTGHARGAVRWAGAQTRRLEAGMEGGGLREETGVWGKGGAAEGRNRCLGVRGCGSGKSQMRWKGWTE